MKKILPLLLIVCHYLYSTIEQSSEKPFVILICSYNNKPWYRFNLHSVFKQRYSNYRVIYIDDCSTDGTGSAVKRFIKARKQEHRVTYIHNEERCGACANTYKGVWLCDPHEIVIILDGDDWFDGPDVLQNLNYHYQDPNIWMTYGQYRYWPSQRLPQDLDRIPLSFENFDRTIVRWRVHYPRTFYAKLFHMIKEDDLKYDGTFLPIACDVGYMLPLFEMCGAEHSKYINKVLVYYNRGTPINDNKVNKELQKTIEHYIRQKPAYPLIHNLWN